MIDYIIKLTFSLGILLAVYHLFLEREKMHRFNRFYLIASVGFSLGLPFITIPVYVEAAQLTEAFAINPAPGLTVSPQPSQPNINYWPYLGWGLYAIATLLLALRFTTNVMKFYSLRKKSCTAAYHNATLVLLEEDVLPHTFGNNIYLSKKDYEQNRIEPELLAHELVHVRQRHTLDILFIEALKIVFWFNPLLHLYKRAIQLNHEFLADEAVVSRSKNIFSYQQLLLQKASTEKTQLLASSITFGTTKKRFTMMTKTTSKTRSLLLKAATLPVLTGLVLLLCTKTIAQEIKLPEIDQKKIDKIEITNVSQAELDSLKKTDRKKYINATVEDYRKTVYTYRDEKGNVAREISYSKMPPNGKEPRFEPAKPAIDHLNLSKIESLQLSDAQMDSLRAARPEWFSKDPNVRFKGTKFRFTDKNGVVTEKIGYQELSSEDKEKVGEIPIYGAESIELWEVPSTSEPKKFNNTKDAMAYLQEDEIYPVAKLDDHPEFPGGITAFNKAIMDKFKTPKLKKGEKYKILLAFVIEEDGSMSDIKVMKDPGHGLGEEAVRAVKTITTKWKPGMKEGKPIKTSYALPLIIDAT